MRALLPLVMLTVLVSPVAARDSPGQPNSAGAGGVPFADVLARLGPWLDACAAPEPPAGGPLSPSPRGRSYVVLRSEERGTYIDFWQFGVDGRFLWYYCVAGRLCQSPILQEGVWVETLVGQQLALWAGNASAPLFFSQVSGASLAGGRTLLASGRVGIDFVIFPFEAVAFSVAARCLPSSAASE